MYPIYVMASGDLLRQTLNAVVTICGSSSFDTVTRLAVLLSIYVASLLFSKQRTVAVFGKWFGVYFAMTFALLGLKMDVEIIDSSNPGAVYTVGNVPVGLGYPLSLITTIGHVLQGEFEKALSMPDDQSYAKTGLLFGSKIYTMATGETIQSADVQEKINAYFKNCVIGDLFINHKYSVSQLKKATDIWATISQNPSPLRGVIFFDEKTKTSKFYTCLEATPILKKAVEGDVQENVLSHFALKMFGKKTPNAISQVNKYLPLAYNYYAGISQTGPRILTQNVMISALRQGIQNYAGETHAVAAMLNYETEKSMHAQQITWAVSKNIIAYTLPLMQTLMIMIMAGCFPIIVLLCMQHVLAGKIFLNYIYTLLWLETWPLLFSIANLAATYHTYSKVGGLGAGGITLGNSNTLALLHSYQANMAGYFMTLIPFIALGLVKGMAYAFNNAANYIGGIAHQRAASAGEEGATGNISLGNLSYGNVNANKWDTNATMMHGQATQQLANGATVTTMADGSAVYNGMPAISQTGTQLHARSSLDQSLTQQASQSRSSAASHRTSAEGSISSFSTDALNYSTQVGHQVSAGHGASHNHSGSMEHAASTLNKVASQVSSRTGMTTNDALRGMTQAAISGNLAGKIHADASTPASRTSGGMITAGGGGSIVVGVSAEGKRDSAHDNNFTRGNDFSLTADELKDARDAYQTIDSYTQNDHTEDSRNTNEQFNQQLAADYRTAKSETEQWSADSQRARHYSDAASFIEHNSAFSDENMQQAFANGIRSDVGDAQAAWILTSQSDGARQLRQTYANQFLAQQKSALMEQFQVEKNKRDVDQFYYTDARPTVGLHSDVKTDHAIQAAKIREQQYKQQLTPDRVNQQVNRIKNDVQKNQSSITQQVKTQTKAIDKTKHQRDKGVHTNIKRGEHNAKRGVTQSFIPIVGSEKGLKNVE